MEEVVLNNIDGFDSAAMLEWAPKSTPRSVKLINRQNRAMSDVTCTALKVFFN